MGVTVLIARYLGEKRPEQIGAVLGGAAVVFTILSVGIFILLVGFARPVSVSTKAFSRPWLRESSIASRPRFLSEAMTLFMVWRGRR